MECRSIMELVGYVGCLGRLELVKRIEGVRTMRTPLVKNITPLPRTWSEAVKDADYASWMEYPKGELEDMVDFGKGMLFMLPLLIICLYLLYVVIWGMK
jgi:hypothetical protein